MYKYLISCVLSILMAISVQSISNAQNDQAAVKDSTTQETISTAQVKDSTAKSDN